MRRRPAALLIFLSVLAPALAHPETRATRVTLTDAGTGREIASHVLAEGERAVLTWTNSLFHLPVTEIFVARAGRLALDSITFEDPTGRAAPLVRPEDVNDLYQTGGPFRAEGLGRAVGRVVFRVGEIGNPTMSIAGRVIRFREEVGFGGAIVLENRPDLK